MRCMTALNITEAEPSVLTYGYGYAYIHIHTRHTVQCVAAMNMSKAEPSESDVCGMLSNAIASTPVSSGVG